MPLSLKVIPIVGVSTQKLKMSDSGSESSTNVSDSVASSSSNLSDLDFEEFCYEKYKLKYYRQLKGPPLIEKKHRLLAAVVQNQVGVLKDILDSPKWYNVTDRWGYNLLQIAILRDNIEVFDYIMSLPDFPLEYENNGQTALVVALVGLVSNEIWVLEHFSYELVKKGACIDKVSSEGSSPLLCALERQYLETAELLLEKEVDVNVCNDKGTSPLDEAMITAIELVPQLLMMGAEPKISHFETLVFKPCFDIVKETYFLYLFDEHSRPKLRLHVILKLAETNPQLFYDLMKLSVEASVEEINTTSVLISLCKMSIKELEVVLEKFGPHLKEILLCDSCESAWLADVISLNNLNLIRESIVGPSLIACVGSLVSSTLCKYMCMMELREKVITEQYCFLLGCNMRVTEFELVSIYKHYGYCELFKILLHMDIEPFDWSFEFKDFMPVLIFNVGIDLGAFLEDPELFSEESVDDLVKYFAHPELKKLYCERADNKLVQKKDNLLEIPLLLEMARNVFRRYLVKKFNLKTSREFYTYLNCLPVSKLHKKIVSYEIKLY